MYSSKLSVLNAFMAGIAANPDINFTAFNPLNIVSKEKIIKSTNKEAEEAIIKAAEEKRARKAKKRLALLNKNIIKNQGM